MMRKNASDAAPAPKPVLRAQSRRPGSAKNAMNFRKQLIARTRKARLPAQSWKRKSLKPIRPK
ncbi:MAG: hypothetical protein BWK80_43650 [Desulfobacteraceae bacterium IS3]|nr:MAG: hypothetical protein BWK80_43650 [Desulfobacteraceae bacterium IS3]